MVFFSAQMLLPVCFLQIQRSGGGQAAGYLTEEMSRDHTWPLLNARKRKNADCGIGKSLHSPYSNASYASQAFITATTQEH